MIRIFGSLIWSKSVKELIFNPCGEVRGAQLAKSTSPPPRCPWDLFRSFKVCSVAKERVECGKHQVATAPIHPL